MLLHTFARKQIHSILLITHAFIFALALHGLTAQPINAWHVVLGFSNALLIFLCLANSQWFLILILPLVLLASSLAAYLQTQMGVIVDSHVIGALLEADATEVRTFLTADIGFVIAASSIVGLVMSWLYAKLCWQGQTWTAGLQHACIVLALLIVFLFGKLALSFDTENIWLILCAAGLMGAWRISRAAPHAWTTVLGLALLLAPALINKKQSATYFPTQLFYAVSQHVTDLMLIAKANANRTDIANLPNAATDIANEEMITVLVIGESARADHFGLNGYARPTTPNLSKKTDVVSFTQAKSCAAATRISVPCLMTRATEQDLSKAASETSIISVFRHFGFDTAWLSTNQLYGQHDTPITVIANEAVTHQFSSLLGDLNRGSFDKDLIEPLQQFLAKPARRKFIVLHQRGSHWNYDDRYPSVFRQFTPVCGSNTPPYLCATDRLKNSYDNSILYTDDVLAEVINQLSNRRALLLYTSDHGQSLGEDGFYTHGSPERPEQRHVPMIWWTSQSFKLAHPEVLQSLAAKRLQPVSHDHVFHSLLGCTGFKGSLIDESLNLCAK